MLHMASHDIASSLNRDRLTRWAAGSTMLAGHDKTIASNKVTAPRLTATQIGWGWGWGKERAPPRKSASAWTGELGRLGQPNSPREAIPDPHAM